MEREILFRGKANDTKEWLMGDLISHTYENPNIRPIGTLNGYIVFPETVGQYTGLTDKNGRRIFEGDIVNVKTISGSFINYVITWFNSDLCWVMQSLKDTSVKFRLRSCWEFEVVDNIHDNPELMKGEK